MSKLLTLTQAQSIANGVIDKVKNKGYAVAADLGALASKDEVAKSDLASALATELDAKALASDLNTVAGKVTTLIGNVSGDDAKSARTISAEEVAKIVASAPESLDTLKEIADWISSHSDDAAAMNSAIVALQGKTVLGTHEVEGQQVEYATVKAYVEAVMAAAALSEGNGIDINNGVVSAEVVAANGLSLGNSGIAMDVASPSTSGVGGSNGAMLATDKEKLDDIQIATTSEVEAVIAALDNL